VKYPTASPGARQLRCVFDEFLARQPAQVAVGQARRTDTADLHCEIPCRPLQLAGIVVGFEQHRQGGTKLGDDFKTMWLRHFG
jgi:hypothetical protein